MYILKVGIVLLLSLTVLCEEYEDAFEEYADQFKNIIVHEDYGLDIYNFLYKYNYPTQTHWVQTEDGYVLRMQRISSRHGNFADSKNKPAILLMHGILSSAMDFVFMGPNKSLGLVLADAGFDVWLGNNRGNTWSRQHVTLDPDIDAKFWDYSFETCGYYDLPAKIDYIIEQTGQEKIFYVGHSQGTTQFFAMTALRPEYNDKIALMSALAPVAFMKHLSSPIPRFMGKYMDIIKLAADLFHIHEFLGHSWLISEIAKQFCSDNSTVQESCAIFLFTLCGYDSPQLDRSLIPVLASNAPAGISIKMLLHYGQEIRSGYFRRFDHGLLLNLKYYKSVTPPAFQLSAITAPVALYYSQNDYFAAVQDVERLATELPNVVKKRLIEYKLFNHLDFIFAKNTNEIINMDLVAHLKEYVKGPTSGGNNIIIEKYIFITLIITIWTIYFK
ncbi:unnamed protein product [Psylliodes chrysocephalus]|uniref:AB hydrolase-1 domain-containing protein n=1 Tax=Psylliodes chrysocephalus TaxID=3402493 RepID=A0A9P0GCS2_9CUCU|nr:unnamed protein product [Psylliodes chrysocephala]